MRIGTAVRCIKPCMDVEVGDTGVYTFGADYVPGWDAGRFDVTLDSPRARKLVQPHWTLDELLSYWEPIPVAVAA